MGEVWSISLSPSAPSSRQPTNEALIEELDAVRSLLDQGLSTEARSRLASLISAARNNPTVLALARCCLSMALEMQGHYKESLAAIAMYENPDSRAKLSQEAIGQLRVQIGLAYNYNGDHPKAIAMLKSALRDFSEGSAEAKLGPIYGALARVYRNISEFPIARDYAQRALEHFRLTGEWRGLAEAYFGIAVASMQEGKYELGLENFEQALKLIGDQYLARVYRAATQRYRLGEWNTGALRKLDTIESIYQKIHVHASGIRMELLEWIIIALIAFEILLSLVPALWRA